MQLNRFAHDAGDGVTHSLARACTGEGRVARFINGAHRLVQRGARQTQMHEHVDGTMLQGLKAAQRAAELAPRAQVIERGFKQRFAQAEQIGSAGHCTEGLRVAQLC